MRTLDAHLATFLNILTTSRARLCSYPSSYPVFAGYRLPCLHLYLQHLVHICDNVGDIGRSLGGIILYIDNIEITIVLIAKQLPGLRRVSDYEFLLFEPNPQHLMHIMNTFSARVYLFPSVLIESRSTFLHFYLFHYMYVNSDPSSCLAHAGRTSDIFLMVF